MEMGLRGCLLFGLVLLAGRLQVEEASPANGRSAGRATAGSMSSSRFQGSRNIASDHANYVHNDRQLDDVIKQIVEMEEQEKEARRALEFARRGPRTLQLAAERFDPSLAASADCAICLERVDERLAAIKLTRCEHVFHEDCLSKWSLTQDYYDREVSFQLEPWKLISHQ